MTKEEIAIKALENMKRGASCGYTDATEIFDTAIKALSTEPCEDAVSRQAVLDIDFNRIIHTTAKPVEMIRQKVEQLPSVTPTRAKGKWIRHGACNYTCSKCGFPVNQKYDYCVCGAEME